jgi:hypothetical protein
MGMKGEQPAVTPRFDGVDVLVARYFSEPMNRRLRGVKVFTKDELEKIHA